MRLSGELVGKAVPVLLIPHRQHAHGDRDGALSFVLLAGAGLLIKSFLRRMKLILALIRECIDARMGLPPGNNELGSRVPRPSIKL